MDFSKLNGKIYFQNKFINNKEAKIHVLNHSLHFSSAVFEGIRVYNKKILFLEDHLVRLLRSSKVMGLKPDLSLKKLRKIHKKIIEINKIENGYIRPLVYRSSHSMSPDTSKCKSLVCIATWKWPALFASDLGIKLNIARYPKLNNKIYPMEAKSSGSYQISVISRIESAKKKFDDCLMLDIKKNIAETSACNIFWIKKDTVYTSKEHSILDGITRKAVIEICKINKLKVKKGDYLYFSVFYPALKRKLSIKLTKQFPFTIESWEETFTQRGKKLTTKAVKIKTIQSAYWSKNGVADTKERQELKL